MCENCYKLSFYKILSSCIKIELLKFFKEEIKKKRYWINEFIFIIGIIG